ncbi:MAG TPA: ParB/RepB/Spo0J family partition protein [Deltaproteobacteria bacterium]|nr:ParB/RepB/Spo0J family partition protein [Deltaproteobacteria bacterium]
MNDQNRINFDNVEETSSIIKDDTAGVAVADKTNTAEVKAVTDIRVENLDIESLIILPHHPRKFQGNLDSLQNSIRRDGFRVPVLVYEIEDGKYAVTDGTRRIAVAKIFGWKTIPCLIKKGMSASDAAHESYLINTERNSLNPIEIALHIKTMRDEFGFSYADLEIKGYGSKSHIANTQKLLDLPESVQAKIQRGDLSAAHGLQIAKLPTQKEQIRWAKRAIDEDQSAKRTKIQIKRYLEKGKKPKEELKVKAPEGDVSGVYFKDSRDMSELPDESVELVVSSPPYFVGKEYEIGITFDEHIENIKGVLAECARVLVSGGRMALNVGDIHNFKTKIGPKEHRHVEQMGHLYQRFLKKHQIFLTDVIIWHKKITPWRNRPEIAYTPDLVHTEYGLIATYEPVYIFRKAGEREIPTEDVVLRSRLTKEQWVAWIPGLWTIKPVQNQEGHPTIYPDELCSRLIKMFSYEGDTVLDPFLGSGTTVKVARELNRNGIGYEREIQYKATIMEKLGIGQETTENESLKQMRESIEQIHEFGSETAEGEVEMSLKGEGQVPKEGHADGYLEEGKTAQ